jgi:hypothetical protein
MLLCLLASPHTGRRIPCSAFWRIDLLSIAVFALDRVAGCTSLKLCWITWMLLVGHASSAPAGEQVYYMMLHMGHLLTLIQL